MLCRLEIKSFVKYDLRFNISYLSHIFGYLSFHLPFKYWIVCYTKDRNYFNICHNHTYKIEKTNTLRNKCALFNFKRNIYVVYVFIWTGLLANSSFIIARKLNKERA